MSWPLLCFANRRFIPQPAPTPLLKRAGSRQVDVLGGLLYTAYVTRPPTVYGFHLCDYWAWLRYLPAIAASGDLRLCEDWDNVDGHQKAVLSDELGVGFTTQFVSEVFNCSGFTDTLYVVNVLSPTKFSLKSGVKRGPRKSPDYIARYGTSNYIVLECKGTQTFRPSLQGAMTRGQQQKGNILANKSVRIKHSLVAGLFIPQRLAKEGPCIYVSDPRRDELLSFVEPPSMAHGFPCSSASFASFTSLPSLPPLICSLLGHVIRYLRRERFCVSIPL